MLGTYFTPRKFSLVAGLAVLRRAAASSPMVVNSVRISSENSLFGFCAFLPLGSYSSIAGLRVVVKIDSRFSVCVATLGWIESVIMMKIRFAFTGSVGKSTVFSAMMSWRNNPFEFCLFFGSFIWHASSSPRGHCPQLANCCAACAIRNMGVPVELLARRYRLHC